MLQFFAYLVQCVFCYLKVKLVNFQDMFGKAKEMQTKMNEAMEELANTEITGEAGAGMVNIKFNGNGYALSLDIQDDVYKEDKKVLQTLLVAAINDAKRKQKSLKEEKMQACMGQMGLPPGFDLGNMFGGNS